MLRGRLQHPLRSDQAMQTTRVPVRLEDLRYRTNRPSHGEDDGSGPRFSHNIPIAADHVRERCQEQRHRGRPGQSDASELRVGAVPRPAGAERPGRLEAAGAVRQQRRATHLATYPLNLVDPPDWF